MMINMNIIERFFSAWSSPIIPVEKKSGKLRICLDAREINTRIIPDRQVPISIEEILNRFKGSKYLISIDQRAGYWKCPLSKNSREITAFRH